MPQGDLEVVPFARPLLDEQFGDGVGTDYIDRYLTALEAKTCIVESHYIDRHYLDDFTQYYAKSFNSPEPYCSRLLFFSLDSASVELELNRAFGSATGLEEVEARKALQASFLGFIVKRPLKHAAIGRTVLRTYPIDGRRHFDVLRPYVVHLAGCLRLSVDGLAYQQQDGGAAVCASTSLWSALQKAADMAGSRTPTPAAITLAAKSPFPASHGLDTLQMATALSSLGFVADFFAPAENRSLFKAKVAACLRSQLPVILLLARKQTTGAGEVTIGHAVTVTGFSEPKLEAVVPAPIEDAPSIKIKAGHLDVLYVHADNLGSHAHYELLDDNARLDLNGHRRLCMRRGHSDGSAPRGWNVDVWDIEGALVPKPEHMRLSVESLFLDLLWFRRALEDVILPGLDLSYDVRFCNGIEYKRSLFKYSLELTQLRAFHATLSLSRRIGIVSVYGGPGHLVDLILDASEVPGNPEFPSLIGLACPGTPRDSLGWQSFDRLSRLVGCPAIFAPKTS